LKEDILSREAFDQFPSFIRMLSGSSYLTHQSGKWWEGSYQDGGFKHGMTHRDSKRGGRHGDWKLIVRYNGKDKIKYKVLHTWDKLPYIFYNLKKDPNEIKNLADENPEKVKELKAQILEWHRKNLSVVKK